MSYTRKIYALSYAVSIVSLVLIFVAVLDCHSEICNVFQCNTLS